MNANFVIMITVTKIFMQLHKETFVVFYYLSILFSNIEGMQSSCQYIHECQVHNVVSVSNENL